MAHFQSPINNYILISFLVISMSMADAAAPCEEPSHPLHVALPQQLAPLRRWIKDHKQHSKYRDDEYLNEQLLDASNEGYIADAKNDGHEKYILATVSEGTLRDRPEFEIFEKAGSGFHHLDNDFLSSDDASILERRCGKIIITSWHGTHARLWEKGEEHKICDQRWINFHREKALTFFKKKQFTAFSNHLGSLEDFCRKEIPTDTRFWIKNDIALGLQKQQKTESCLLVINQLKADPDFLRASDALKKAVASNERLCKAGKP